MIAPRLIDRATECVFICRKLGYLFLYLISYLEYY